jgi:hypothetical protein
VLAGLALAGVIRYLVQKRQEVPARMAAFLAAAIGFSVAATLYYAHYYNSDQGRYLFPALIPIMTFLALGLSTLSPARYHRLILDGMLFVLAGINALVLARLAHIYWQIL